MAVGLCQMDLAAECSGRVDVSEKNRSDPP